MLATLIPLFDDKMNVCAYSVFAQRENLLLNPGFAGSAKYDGASNIVGFDIINSTGVDTLGDKADVFVEINSISVFSDIEAQTDAPNERVVLLFDNSIKPDATYVERIRNLKERGFKTAIRKLTIDKFEAYREILLMMDYLLLDHKKINIKNAKGILSKVYPNLKLVAVNVNTGDDYDMLKDQGGYHLYEGDFFRMPVTEKATEIAPLKVNYIELLNIVNAPDFDLTTAADVIGRDTALVISLLDMVNRMTLNAGITSVSHAAAMLGQAELKKWINTAVAKELCADKPSEITRISLLRAKFAETLAPYFEMAGLASEMFLCGMFSVLDIMLDQPMEEALKVVKVSKNITDALLYDKGNLAPLLRFVKQYENASWQEVSRIMLLDKIEMNDVYNSYISTLEWYRDLFRQI